MKTKNELNQDITNIIMIIHTQFPELSKYIGEIPENNSGIYTHKLGTQRFKKYYQSLKKIVLEYEKSHMNKMVAVSSDLTADPIYSDSEDINLLGKTKAPKATAEPCQKTKDISKSTTFKSGQGLHNMLSNNLPAGITVSDPLEEASELVNKSGTSDHEKITFLFIRENGWLKKINIADISWIKAEGTYTQLSVDGKQYTLRNSVKELMTKLSAYQFSRIHKSFIVNIHKVEALSSTSVKMDDIELPVGRIYYSQILKKINFI